MNTRRAGRWLIAPVLAVAAVALAACGGSDSDTLEVSGAWARTSAMDAANGAAYMTLTSPTDDAVVAASVDMSVAMKAEVHETTMQADGSMAMQEVNSVALPAGEAVEFAPGGFHVMLMGLAAPLEIGSTVSITLSLESGDSIVVDAEVREEAP